MANIAVVVGKFQCPELTDGHKKLIDYCFEKYDEVFILVGYYPILNKKYFVPDGIVQEIIDNYICKERTRLNKDWSVGSIKDVFNAKKWSSILDDKIEEYVDKNYPDEHRFRAKITLVGGRDSFLDHYIGKYKDSIDRIPGDDADKISATKVRQSILDKGFQNDPKFIEGAIYDRLTHYPTAYQAVDILIKDPSGEYVLLGRKHYQDKYRFVGGMSDPKSESLEEDAIREVKEETNLVVQHLKYVASMKVNDPRYRGTEDCIKSVLFVGHATSIDAVAQDDLKGGEVRWFKIEDVIVDLFVDEHIDLFHMYLKKGYLE